jgi:hypothetical protein
MDPAPTQGTTVVEATSDECPDGGISFVGFADVNGNGRLDSGETVTLRQKVCNGARGVAGETGAQGFGAGVAVATASALQCPAGGVVLTAFQDTDNNGALNGDEQVTSTSTVCNGVSGSDGRSAYLTVSTASAQQCSSGGFVYTASSPGDTPVVSIVCNGSNGTNGTNGTDAVVERGPVGDPVNGKNYTACHHDYVYIPGATRSTGWLLFRHQGNGSYDQGIGSTGFQVWTVDIRDFLLISEVGGVAYCSLHWDATGRTLSYTVVDPSDGLAGQSGMLIL